ncbi:MAG: Trm112 family protein [Candidatus Aenigmarchaeota archaeon]|nr:Trm112 family protein [Candidatus Aenigmarchaeota archaeon]
MKESLMEILACPICKSHPLKLHIYQRTEEEISEGVILCSECERWYPIIDEIPHMLPDDLRKKKDDTEFLKKWKQKIPEKILREGKPHRLADRKKRKQKLKN